MKGPRPENDERIMELTARGWSTPQIAAEIGCTERTVTRARVRCGIAKPPPRPYTSEELERIEELLGDGWSIAEIARTLGRDLNRLYLRFPGRGWSPSDTGCYNAARRLALKLDI